MPGSGGLLQIFRMLDEEVADGVPADRGEEVGGAGLERLALVASAVENGPAGQLDQRHVRRADVLQREAPVDDAVTLAVEDERAAGRLEHAVELAGVGDDVLAQRLLR